MPDSDIITSLHNPRIKAAARLRDARQRHKTGKIVIDGRREVERALTAGVEIVEVYVLVEQAAELAALVDRLRSRGAAVATVNASVFERLAFGQRQEGIVAVARPPQRRLGELRLPPEPLVAVLVGLEKPGNIGAILRSADGAGLDAVIMADGRTDLYNPNAIRASLGTLFTQQVAEATSAEVIAWLAERGIAAVTTRPDASALYCEADLRGPIALVLGAEDRGLPPAWQQSAGRAVRLPMLGAADSLNVAATAAVIFYEVLRQRTTS